MSEIAPQRHPPHQAETESGSPKTADEHVEELWQQPGESAGWPLNAFPGEFRPEPGDSCPVGLVGLGGDDSGLSQSHFAPVATVLASPFGVVVCSEATATPSVANDPRKTLPGERGSEPANLPTGSLSRTGDSCANETSLDRSQHSLGLAKDASGSVVVPQTPSHRYKTWAEADGLPEISAPPGETALRAGLPRGLPRANSVRPGTQAGGLPWLHEQRQLPVPPRSE